MIKKCIGAGALVALLALTSACGTDNAQTTGAQTATETAQPTAAASPGADKPAQQAAPKTITYLNQTYTVPVPTDKIAITGSLEAMEDALMLGVKPLGGITVGGKFPAMFTDITADTQSVGEKAQPNVEAILKLKPDVILGTTKFPADVAAKLTQITTTIPVSYLATDWEANLRLLAQLTGKEEQAEKVLADYKNDIAEAKSKLGDKLKDKKVIVARIRTGSIMIYRDDVFFNPALYTDLGLTAPAEIKAAKTQEIVSLEKFSEINPDYLFLQFAEDENKDKPQALEDLQNNPIWQSINAVKNKKVFVNVVDPLAQGGTAWSKIQFLKAVADKLSGE